MTFEMPLMRFGEPDWKLFDYVLTHFDQKEYIEKAIAILNKNNFIYHFTADDIESRTKYNNLFIVYHMEKIKEDPRFSDLICHNHEFHLPIRRNMVFYFLLQNEQFQTIDIFASKKYRNKKVFKEIEEMIDMKSLDPDDPEQYMMLFYPALRWYLSDETKHKYPPTLLKRMDAYAKELEQADLNYFKDRKDIFSVREGLRK